MPTVLREEGFSFRIYVDDHRPPHVHVITNGTEVVIYLGNEDERPSIRERRGMTDRNAVKALRLVMDRQEYLLAKWREIHA
ncbi:MAG: DUF4160 domain-containing protein [Candidatus Sericytochromatia bacterium]